MACQSVGILLTLLLFGSRSRRRCLKLLSRCNVPKCDRPTPLGFLVRPSEPGEGSAPHRNLSETVLQYPDLFPIVFCHELGNRCPRICICHLLQSGYQRGAGLLLRQEINHNNYIISVIGRRHVIVILADERRKVQSSALYFSSHRKEMGWQEEGREKM